MKHLTNLLLILIVLSQPSCTKEVITIIETEKVYHWKEQEAFSHFSKIQLNSHSNDDQLLIMGINTLTQIIKNDAMPDSIETQTYWINHTNTVVSRLPITDDIFIGKSENTLSLNTCYNLGDFAYTKWIRLLEVDSMAAGITSIDAFRGENIGLNQANRCLVPYNRYSDSTNTLIKSGENFLLISYRIEKEESDQIQVDNIERISFNSDKGGFFKIESIDEYFFVVFAYGTYRIDKNGVVVSVHGGLINDIIKVGEKYVATGASGILYSYDKGLTWHKKADEMDDYLRYATYETVDDKIIGFINSQIWEFSFGETEITLKELDNDGLEGHKITSISKFYHDVYVTSLSGVFKKKAQEFFQYK